MRRGVLLPVIVTLAFAGCGSSPGPSGNSAAAPSASDPVAPAPAAPGSSTAPVVSPSASPSATASEGADLSPAPLPSGAAVGIDGVVRPAALAFRTPLAVLIDDNLAARPQSGFNAAALGLSGAGRRR